MNEISQILKSSGSLLLTTGNNRHFFSFFCLNPFIFLENIFGIYLPSILLPRKLVDKAVVPFYHVRFARKELIELINKAGLQIEKLQTFGYLLSTRLPLNLIRVLEKTLFFIAIIKYLGSGFFIIAKKSDSSKK